MSDPAPGGGRSRSEWFLAPLPGADELAEPAPEEPSPEPAGATTVEPARTRARGLALLAGAVALVAGAVVLGDGDEGGNRAGEAIATTTTSRRPVTTTTKPLRERPATGPLLPEPTGAALVVVTDSQVLIVELDTGAVRSVAVAGRDSYHGAWAVGDAVVVQTSGEVIAVPVRTGQSPVVLSGGRSGAWPDGPVRSDRPGHLWLVSGAGRGLEAREVSLDGRESGRRLALPGVHGFPTVAVHGGVVVEQLGSLTFYDPDTGEARAIGHGVALAGSGETLARVSCEALRCRLQLTSLRTGAGAEVRPPPEAEFIPFAPAAFSPDGRWLIATVGTPANGYERAVVVDVATGEVVTEHRAVPGHGNPIAFSPDSRWLFLLDGRDVVAHRLGTEETLTLERLHPGGAIALAAVPLSE